MPGLANLRTCFFDGTAPACLGRAAIALLLLGTIRAAHATTADDLCLPTADPCIVPAFVVVDDGSLIDVGTRTLRVTGRLDVRTGSMTLNAGRLEVPIGGELRARGDNLLPGGEITVSAGSMQIDGSIDTSGSPGGTVDLSSPGDLNVSGAIEADSLTNDELGGSVTISGGAAVTLGGPVTAQGGRERFGGDIDIGAAGALRVMAAVNASGGSGGTIELATNGGGIFLAGTAEVLADAAGSGEDGGSIDLSTSIVGTIEVRGVVSAVGRASSDGGGDGGILGIDAAEDFILAPGASVTGNSGSPDGTGSGLDLSAGGMMQIAGRIELRGLGAEADAGEILADAEGSAEVTGTIDLRGGNAGGTIDLSAEGDAIVVGGNGRIDATASGDGAGGSIALDSEARLTVSGDLITDGGTQAGSTGGQIDLDGCSIEIAAGATLSSMRSAGSNVVIGREETVVAGTMRADPAQGRNQFRYPSLEQEPIILGSATIVPSAILSADPVIQPCVPRTPSPTRTPTPTPTPGGATPTRSATGTPLGPLCPGDCNADGVVGIDELVQAVAAALSQPGASACGGIDRNENGVIEIDELVAAVSASVLGCG